MLLVKNFHKKGSNNNEFIIDFNKCKKGEKKIEVLSDCAWYVNADSNVHFTYKQEGPTSLIVTADLECLKKIEYFYIINQKKEFIKVHLLPNMEESSEKTYIFKTKRVTAKGRKVKVLLKSEVNTKPQSWFVSYEGRPLKYAISPLSGTGDCSIEINLLSTLYSPLNGVIELKQDKSEKVIRLDLFHQDNFSTKVKKKLPD